MNLKSRIRRLEARGGLYLTRPPIVFFDRLLNDTATQQERQRWLPWITAHLAKTVDSEVAKDALCSQSEPQ